MKINKQNTISLSPLKQYNDMRTLSEMNHLLIDENMKNFSQKIQKKLRDQQKTTGENKAE